MTRTLVSDKLAHLFFPRLWSYEGVGLHPRALLVDRRLKPGMTSWPNHRLVRDYVTNVLSRPLDDAATAFLSRLQAANAKLRASQPLHYKARMRYVLGFREVLRGLGSGRVKFLVVAPDIEPVPGPGGLDAQLMRIFAACGIEYRPAFGVTPAVLREHEAAEARRREQADAADRLAGGARRHVPRCVFALNRQVLGRIFHQPHRSISVVGVFSADGAYEELRTMLDLAAAATDEYREIMEQQPALAAAAASSSSSSAVANVGAGSAD